MIEAWGRGIQRIMDICREAGNPTPTWRLEAGGGGLWMKFPFSAAYQAADATARGIAVQETTQETTRDRILDYLRAEPELTQRVLAERVGLTPDGVRYHLRKLKAAGALRRVGSDRAGSWEVLW